MNPKVKIQLDVETAVYLGVIAGITPLIPDRNYSETHYKVEIEIEKNGKRFMLNGPLLSREDFNMNIRELIYQTENEFEEMGSVELMYTNTKVRFEFRPARDKFTYFGIKFGKESTPDWWANSSECRVGGEVKNSKLIEKLKELKRISEMIT